MDLLLESYINGNISFVRNELLHTLYTFSDFVDRYIDVYQPSVDDINLFIKRLS